MALTQKQKKYIREHYPKLSADDFTEKLNADPEEIRAFVEELKTPISPKKRLLFTVLTLLIPVLFFLVVEGGLRLFEYKGNTDLFIDTGLKNPRMLAPNPNFAARYFFYTNTVPTASTDFFRAEKPENGYRVFVMGGSSTAGYPYGFNGMFSRTVKDMLNDLMPDREVEVVNIGISAVNSYTLYDQVEEVLEQQPDAILFYAGHNEFYGALGVGSSESLGAFPGFVRFYLDIQQLKTFMALRDLYVDLATGVAKLLKTDNYDPGATLMKRMVKSQSIPLNSTTYQLAREQFRSNINVIMDQFGQAGVPVYIGSLASNLKDHVPFISSATDSLPPAEEVFFEARKLLQAGETAQAREKFIYAKDLDALKFRAPSEWNRIIKQVSERDHVTYVPVFEEMMEASEDGIIGNELMLEHLHPNRRGYFLMGKSFLSAMLRNRLNGEAYDIRSLHPLDSYFERMYMSEFDSLIAVHRMEILKNDWPFVDKRPEQHYALSYNFESLADTLAYRMVNKNKNWDRLKVQLAQHYHANGKPEKAVYEYLGLARNQPWNDSPHFFAGKILFEEREFQRAKPLLEEAYQIDPNPIVTKMLGATEVHFKNVKRGIVLLEEAISKNPDDPQALFNLSGAYGLDGEIKRAYEIALRVEKIDPNFAGLAAWKQQLETVIARQRDN